MRARCGCRSSTGGGDVVGKRFADLVCIVVHEVDLAVGAVEAEAEAEAETEAEAEGYGTTPTLLDSVAGQVVDEVRGDRRRHGYYCLSVGMRAFAAAWADGEVVQQAVADLPWVHHRAPQPSRRPEDRQLVRRTGP